MTSNDRELRKLPSGRTLLPGHGFPLPAGTSAGTGNAASQGSTAAAAAIDSSNPSATGPAGDTRGLAHPSATWSEQDNTVLLLARSQGIGYRQIAEEYLPHHGMAGCQSQVMRLRKKYKVKSS